MTEETFIGQKCKLSWCEMVWNLVLKNTVFIQWYLGEGWWKQDVGIKVYPNDMNSCLSLKSYCTNISILFVFYGYCNKLSKIFQ